MTAMIQVDNVTKRYGKKEATFAALDDINLTIEKGSTVAVVGKSGSGKSTLMHVMSGLDSVTAGSITIDGQALNEMKPKAVDAFRAKRMGFIFQSFFVQANESCYDNVALSLEIAGVNKNRRQLTETALEQVELADKASNKAKNLSGGQKQRLAIARAIVSTPDVLFADEPTGNLDSTTGETIEKLLFDLNKRLGCTLVIVTHDQELADKCAVRVYMKDGRVERVVKAKGSKK